MAGSGKGEWGQDPKELSDELIVAAVQRASLQAPGVRQGSRAGATLRELRDHLGLAARSAATRGLTARLAALEAGGLLARTREHGVATWAPREAARDLLAGAAGSFALPESPQHARWRRARTLARSERGRLAADLRGSLRSCVGLLDRLDGPTGRAAHSDEWFALAERLRRGCRRVGSAQHILHEWPEPDETRPDTDTLSDPLDGVLGEGLPAVRALRAGRRNTRLWQAPG